jgi:ribosomal protein L11 methyltransferase
MDFVEIDILCEKDLKDILTAELSELGYESFLDTHHGFRAYQPIKNHNPAMVAELLIRYSVNDDFKSKRLVDKNWNELWEQNFEPFEIGKNCRVRASHHSPNENFDYEIIIDPKMAFGTGHHETTRQVARYQLELNQQGKSVLDVGCGTGILSILAEMRGAAQITGIDTDTYAVSNTIENIVLNNCKNIKVREGTIRNIEPTSTFDLILANINRNVLLEEIKLYHKFLKANGSLILSGFYTYDSQAIVNECKALGLKLTRQTEENQWACILLEKTSE